MSQPFAFSRLRHLALTLLIAVPVSAQGPELVLDINPNFGDSSLNPDDIVPLLSLSVFDGSTPETGNELWSTDGTALGTGQLIDVIPGPQSGLIGHGLDSVVMNGEAFFSAGEILSGTGLWATDGTSEGTRLVKAFKHGAHTGVAGFLGATANTLFFCADDGVHGDELWSTDGTEAGTSLVLDIAPGTTSGCVPNSGRSLIVGSTLFFNGSATNGAELWTSDGTPSGTMEVADINAGVGDSSPNQFLVYGTDAVFVASNGTSSRLWKSDGTSVGTVEIPSNGTTFIRPKIVFDGNLFFSARNGTDDGLYKTDGTTTVRLQDSAGMDFSVDGFTTPEVLGNHFFFPGANGGIQYELWRSNGTSAGTGQVAELEPGTAGSQPKSLRTIGNRIVFTADTTGFGRELWATNGSTLTEMVVDLNGTSDDGIDFGSEIGTLGNSNVALFEGITAQGRELWRTDGTAVGTQRLTDVVAHQSSNPQSFQPWNDGVAFVYSHVDDFFDPEHRLGESDGTAANTDQLSSLGGNLNLVGATGLAGSSVVALVVDIAQDSIDLWRSTLSGTILVTDVGFATQSRARSANGMFVWLATTGGERIYASNGVTSGDAVDAEVVEVCGSSAGESFELIGDLLFFADELNCRPWVMNLDTGTSFELSDMGAAFNPGAVFFATYGSRALLYADDGPVPGQLWSSDGTTQGTIALPLILDTNAASADQPGTAGPDGHYFTAKVGGVEQVWKSDGTVAGTALVVEPPAGEEVNFAPASAEAPGSGVFWIGSSGIWFSDGTSSGTSVIVPATSLSGPELVATWGDVLVVTANRDGHGREMAAVSMLGSVYWLDDIEPGGVGTTVGEAFIAGDILYFAAFRSDIGTELFKVDLNQLPFFSDGFESGDVAAWQ